jgi:signal transduction histidine kinase
MARLYFRIYLAVLGSLVLLAMLAGASWRLLGDFDRFGPRPEFYPAAVAQLAAPATAPLAVQRATLERWSELSGYELALFDRDGRVIADTSDGVIVAPFAAEWRGGPGRWRGPHWTQAVELDDGRWLVAARPRAERGQLRRFAWLGALGAITLVVGICAYPVVRRLTRRLEELQHSVAALGAGNLSSRVKVEGRDEVARLAETFNRSAERIEALLIANKSLLANASHELRSPLTRLRMGIEALPANIDANARSELARNIQELDLLIEEILLASRLDAENVDRARFEAVDLVALLAEECARGDAELDVATPSLPVLQADARLLRRLFRNLLDNARRHGGGGAVEVTVRNANTGLVAVDVCDRGPGVPAAQRERIFEPFYRLPGARERDGGVGLGLALVRKIAEQHGGTVACLPRKGGGSCFRVTLPAVAEPVTNAITAAAPVG